MANSMGSTADQLQQPEPEGWLTGKRGRKNKFAMVSWPVIGLAVWGLSHIDIQPTPDDLVHGAFLQDNFSETIEVAIGSPNTRHYVLPEHLTEAGNLYAQYRETQSSIQDTHAEGNRTAAIAMADVENSQAWQDAQNMFRQGADGSGNGEVVVHGVRCDTTAEENIYSCQLTRAEIGGFEDVSGGLDACQRVTDRFTVTASIDGAIDYLSTRGPSFPTSINVDVDKLEDEGFTDRLSRHFVAVVIGDIAYYGAHENPQEYTAFRAFSGCLAGGPPVN